MSNELTVPVRKLFTLMLVILPMVSAMRAPSLARRQVAVRRIGQASDHFLGGLEIAADPKLSRDERLVRRKLAACDREPCLGSHRDDHIRALGLGAPRLPPGDFPVVDALLLAAADQAQMNAPFGLRILERGREPVETRLDVARLLLTYQGREPRER